MRALYTITNQTAQVRYAGNGVTTAFSVTFQFFEASTLRVRIATGAAAARKTLGVDYTVSGGAGEVGVVTFTTAPATGTNVLIDLDMPLTQETIDLAPNGPLPAEDVEQGFDRVVTMVKQISQAVDSTPEMDVTYDPNAPRPTFPPPSPGMLVAGKGDASGWENVAVSSLPTASIPVTLSNPALGDLLVHNGGAFVNAGKLWSPRPLGGKGDGVANDTAAVQGAIDAAAAAGGGAVDLTGGRWLIDSADLVVKEGVYLIGPWRNLGYLLNNDYSTVKSAIVLNPAYTIKLQGKASGVQGLAIFRKGVINPTSLREGLDAIAAFSGKGITVGQGATGSTRALDCYVGHCFILGFEYGIYNDFSERLRIEWVSGDNENGIYVTGSFDVQHCTRVHFWPFLTAYKSWVLTEYAVSDAVDNGSGLIRLTIASHALQTGDSISTRSIGGVTGAFGRYLVTVIDSTTIDLQGSTFGGTYTSGGIVTASAYYRSGVGINLDTDTDWAQLDNCFTYGYATGIRVNNSDYSTLINCGADNYAPIVDPSTVGIHIAGTSKAAALIGCKAAAQGTNLRIETAGLHDEDVAMVTNFRSWGAVTYIYEFLDGNVTLLGCHGQMSKTIRVGANAGTVNFIGGNLTGVTMSYATGAPLASFQNVVGATSPARTVSNGVSGSRIIAEDVAHNSSPASNDGLTRHTYITNASGVEVEAVRQSIRLSTVTAGAEEAQMFWGVRTSGVLADKLLLVGTFLSPVSNGAIALGAPTLGWSGACFSANTQLNWGNGDYTVTQGGVVLTFSGAARFSPGSSQTPADNGQVTFELTNNTTLTFRAKGSDGTVRSGTITLS